MLITTAVTAQHEQGTSRGIPVVFGVCLCMVAVWYLLRALAPHWPYGASAVRWLSPRTRGMHVWIVSAPATFGYIAIFTASTLVQRTAPPQLINLLTKMDSTSLTRLRLAPLSVIADSAIWVADHGTGLAAYVVGFATVVAWAERRYGTPRIIVICLAGHVFGTLLTARVELHAIQTGLAPASLANSTDVGVSYIMVAGLAAAVLVMQRRWQLVCGLALAAGVVAPVFISHTIWDLGHLLATLCGLAAAALMLLAAPPRPFPRLLPGAAPAPGRKGAVAAGQGVGVAVDGGPVAAAGRDVAAGVDGSPVAAAGGDAIPVPAHDAADEPGDSPPPGCRSTQTSRSKTAPSRAGPGARKSGSGSTGL